MGLRELLILLLGLAIVAVILRGLYVAIQARRGQIRLAIDKNIPSDLDLEALEMAELPSGGARVIPRTAAEEAAANQIEDDPVEMANERAGSLDLGHDDEAVPVLMDSVLVGSSNGSGIEEETGQDFEDEFDTEPFEAATDTPETDWSDCSDPADADSDEVLFDYEVTQSDNGSDGLASVMPDYPDEVESHAESLEEDDEEVTGEIESEDSEDGFYDDELSDFEESREQPAETVARVEPSFDPAVADDEFDDFSMTAGERIGGDTRKGDAGQSSLFSHENQDEPATPPAKRKTLFSALSGRFKSQFDNLRERSGEEIGIDEGESNLRQAREDSVAPVREETDFSRATPTQQIDLESAIESEVDDEAEYGEYEQDEALSEAQMATPEPAPVVADQRTQTPAPQKSEVRRQESATQSSEVIVLNVMSRGGGNFRGEDLIHTIIASGMKFGDMQIFHHRFGKGSNGPVIFSLANILNPGTFDLNQMAQFKTIGVSLFMAMPTPINNLDAFEQMLAVAQQLCMTLDGELKDDHRNVMTAQTIEHYRQRIRDFELRQLKTAGSRG